MDLNIKDFKLTDYQLLTPGLFSGDSIEIYINWRVQAFSFWRYAGWETHIEGELDGQRASLVLMSTGDYGGQDNAKLVFTGKMPSGKELRGKLLFRGRQTFPLIDFAEVPLVIPNLDDVPPPTPPDGDPPTVCTEGQTRCDGYDQLVCKNGSWMIKEYNSAACGYVLPPICSEGTRRCVGTTLQKCINNQWITEKSNATECGYVSPPPPTPPDGEPPTPPADESWFERNKTLIIVISIAMLAIAVVILVSKTKVRSPIESPPKFQRPIIRR